MATANDDLAGSSMVLREEEPEERARVVWHAAERAQSKDELLMFLDMLGLEASECLVEVKR